MRYRLVNNQKPIYEQSDILAATGVNPGTLQAWQSRGIVSSSLASQGTGTRRMYTAADAFRIATLQEMIGFKIPAAHALAMCEGWFNERRLSLFDNDDYWNKMPMPVEGRSPERHILVIFQGPNDQPLAKAGSFTTLWQPVFDNEWNRLGWEIAQTGAQQWHLIDLYSLAVRVMPKLEEARKQRKSRRKSSSVK
jgi:hypothetical protein